MRRNWFIVFVFVAATICTVLSFYLSSFTQPENVLKKSVSSAEKKLDELNREFNRYWKNIQSDPAWFVHHDDSIPKLFNAPYTLLSYTNDSLVFWNNNKILPRSVSNGFGFVKYKTGYYVTISQRVEIDSSHSQQLLFFIPVKYSFVTENEYLKHEYSSLFSVPDWIGISEKENILGEPVHSPSGEILFYFYYSIPFQNDEPQPLAVILFFSGILFLLIAIHYAFVYWLNKISWSIRFLFALAFPVIVFYLLNHLYLIPAGVIGMKMFAADVFASPDIGSSLGCLLIQSLAGAWSVIYIYFFIEFPKQRARWFNLLAVFLVVSLLFFIGVYFIYSVKGLSRDSKLLIGFLNPITPNYLSLLALICISVFAFCFFMLAQKFSEFVRSVSINSIERLLVISIAGVITTLYSNEFHFDFPTVYISIGIVLLAVVIYILDIRNLIRIDLVRLFVLLIIFSVGCALLTTYFRKENDLNSRVALAHKLINERDNVTEFLLTDMRPQIEADIFIRNYFQNPFLISYREFSDRLRQMYFSFGFSRYEVDFFAFNSEGSPLNNEEGRNADNFGNEILNNSQTLIAGKLFYFNTRLNGSGYYDFYPIIVDGNYLGRLFIVLRSKLLNRINVYPELLLEEKDKIPEEAQSYSFAIYENNRLSESSGRFEYPVFDSLGNTIKELNDPVQISNGAIEHIVLKQSDGDTVIVSKELNPIQEFFSAFSYLFVAAFLFVVLISLTFYIYLYARGSAHFFSFAEASFRNIIQLSFIFIIFLSVLFLGLFIGRLFQSQFNISSKEKLSEKMKEVEQSVRYVVSNTISFDSLCGFTPRDLSSMLNININDFTALHDMDVNFYDRHGVLLTSSQPSIFEKGLQSRMMDSRAFHVMQKNIPSEIIQEESVGKLKYLSGYKPIYNEDGQFLAYLNIPYFNTYRLLNEQIGYFFSTLINILVTALILAGFLAPFISRQITRKLSTIAAKFKQVTVGGKNQPIEWKARDELAVLVNEFNKMILKLDESAQQLARSERESAWREMAQQVAHEIKNPLTPMKLSIQHLQRAYDSNDPRADELAAKVSRTLVEQIDNLSKIATEFSSFAKMPKPENEKMHLLEVVYHSVNLYKQNEGVNISIHTEGRINDEIFADKNQLLRVFNNLILNSIQAIPTGQEGMIQVTASNNDRKIIVSVHDNGSGISEDRKQNIFVPNFTTKSSGTGLGLAITKNIIEMAGGKIWFESEENFGTTFFVELPVFS